jgi:hypothetical protein
MMKLRKLTVSATLAATIGVVGALAVNYETNSAHATGFDGFGFGLRVLGLTADGRLISFRQFKPWHAQNLGAITGLTGSDTAIVGIDVRPANGQLYGLGNAGGIYTIGNNAAASFVSQVSVGLLGASFGVDFNPTVDRLRIVSDTGQNLRVNVDTGAALVDLDLTYTPPTAATGVTGAAYTNNDSDPNTATTLYDIDSNLDQVVIQAPPNNGTLNPTGKLLVDAGSAVGFDIYSYQFNNTTLTVQGFASLIVGGQSRFFTINLITGRANARGSFSAQNQVVDIAIPVNQ